MGTNADTIGVAARPAWFTLWTAAVSALVAVALVMSAVALTLAARDRAVSGVADGGTQGTVEAPTWDAAKLTAMEGRMLAESPRISGYAAPWDAAKVTAMEGRMLAESARYEGSVP